MRSGKKKYNCQKCNSSGHNTTTCTATTQAKGKAGAATAKYKKKSNTNKANTVAEETG